LLEDLRRKETPARIAAAFHQGLAEAVVVLPEQRDNPAWSYPAAAFKTGC
jgi:hypothetical protein